MTQNKINKKMVMALGLCLIMCLGCLSGCSILTPTINLNDYTAVTFDGYDGYGTAMVKVDLDAIGEDYGEKVKVSEDFQDAFDEPDLEGLIRGAVSVSIDKASDLSNGDEVTVSFDIDEEYIEQFANCSLTGEEESFVVEGLQEVGTVDVFDGVDVAFTGISPDGQVALQSGDSFPIGTNETTYKWSVSPESGLSNDDTVTVSFEVTDANAFIQAYGAMPAETSKEFTVSGLDRYVTDISQLSDDNINTLKSEAKDQVEAKVAHDVQYEWFGNAVTGTGITIKIQKYTSSDKLTLENAYFLSQKPSDNVYWGNNAKYEFVFVYSSTITNTDSNAQGKAYYVVAFKDLILEDDGTLVGYSDPSTSSYYTSIDSVYQDYVSANKDNYEITVYDGDLNISK